MIQPHPLPVEVVFLMHNIRSWRPPFSHSIPSTNEVGLELRGIVLAFGSVSFPQYNPVIMHG